MSSFGRIAVLSLLLLAIASIAPARAAFAADTPADVQAQIDQHNAAITELNAEIAAYQKQLDVLGGQKQTLTSAIKTIDVSRAQTSTQVQVTQNKIGATDLQLTQIRGDIATKQQLIDLDRNTVAKAIRDLQAATQASVVEQLFAADNLTDAWTDIDNTAAVTDALRTQVNVLSGAKVQLADQELNASQTRDKLASLQKELVAQQKALDANKAAKAQLLAQTNNQESSYQSLIAQKKAQEKTFETELSSLESSLKPVKAAAVPHVGQGVLAWPFSDAFAQSCLGKAKALGNNFCITQYFGNTPFATANPQIYNGSGHNAIDIGMPIGTPVQAALSGTILGTGNTDLAHSASGQQCLSFGKWVMIKHANGLDTLYAHLSQISVTVGQAVTTGDVIGYSGMTGYATGPHLHFGVYASAGVQITTLGEYRGATTPCQNASLPVSPVSGYLNPMSYL
ncbi:MAG TPA: peptidoglycan DD-metalloendopeptidase family protein [Candidatus Paceibacterota bacterium]|jgi:murein DD-endopeptidase MepM/ murein hydrolase activator NlpD|nr:peptidoglycan DD-metalloendopeptidase family protein [Candidatus Paceibacterota bacterium]